MNTGKRRLVLAATGATLATGGVLLTGASAMAAPAAPMSESTTGPTPATSIQLAGCFYDSYGSMQCESDVRRLPW